VTDTYPGGKNGTEVVLCTIVNGEHWWPGSDKDPYREISATDVIWDFFENHPKQLINLIHMSISFPQVKIVHGQDLNLFLPVNT